MSKKRVVECSTHPSRAIQIDESIPPVAVHLTDIEKSEYVNKRVQVDVRITAAVESFQVPVQFAVECAFVDKNRSACGNCSYRKGSSIRFEATDPTILTLCRKDSDQVERIIKKSLQAQVSEDCRLSIRLVAYTAVQELVVVPQAQVINEGDNGELVDEKGRDYRQKIVYLAGNLIKTDGHFRLTGVVVPHPKTQAATLFVQAVEPLRTDIDAQETTDSIKSEFKKFRAVHDSPELIEIAVNRTLKDVTANITKIYGECRVNILLFVLITFHTVLQFKFNGAKTKGWGEMMVMGDTAQGKSTLVERLVRGIGIGQMTSGSASSRTGLGYSLDTVINNQRIITWGVGPLNDKKAVVVDEAQKFKSEEMEEFSSARSSGVMIVTKSVKAEHPCRVRYVFLANPVSGEPMDNFQYPITAINYQRPADIRRLDVVICVRRGDVPRKVILMLDEEREKVHQSITPKLLQQSILWAWRKGINDVVFEKEATNEILRQSDLMLNKYEDPTIPLVLTDIHEKLARMSVGLAALLHSTDESHEKIVVKQGHVLFLVKKLQQVYDHDNCRFDKYVSAMHINENLDLDDYKRITADIKSRKVDENYKGTMMQVLKAVLSHEFVKQETLEKSLSVGDKPIRASMEILFKHGLIVRTAKGCRKTVKGNKFFEQYFDEDGGNPTTEQQYEVDVNLDKV